MKLSELFETFNQQLNEAIIISSHDIVTIKQALEKCKQYISNAEDDYITHSTIMYNILEPVINDIFKHYVKSPHPFKIDLHIKESLPKYSDDTAGYVSGSWHFYDVYHNRITIKITEDEIKNLNVKKYVEILTHELVHLIQGFNSALKNVKVTKYKTSDDYYGKKIEIDAYAQSIASNIVFDAIRNDILDIRNVQQIIKELSKPRPYNRDPNLYFHRLYKDMFKQNLAIDDIKVWQRLNKKVIEKLNHYIEHHNGKYNGARFDVYLNDELIDSVWYDKNIDLWDIKHGLVNHDGYDPRIIIKRTKRTDKQLSGNL